MRSSSRCLGTWAGLLVLPLVVGCGGGDGGDGTTPPSVRAELTGINDDPHWLINPHDTTLDQSFAGYASGPDLVSFRISRVRFFFSVDDGDLNQAFALYDPVIANYRANGVRVLVVLGGMTVPLDPTNPAAMPVDLIAAGTWHDFVVRYATVANLVADHYGDQVDAYEIMNEMNVTNGAARYIPPDAYSELLQWAHDAIAGRARVVTGGLYGQDDDSGNTGNSYLAGVNLDYADAVAVHPYGYWPGPPETRPQPMVDAGWGTFDDVLGPLSALGKPIWLTEWDIADDNFGDDGQARSDGKKQMFTDFYQYIAGDARVDQAYFFAWSDANESGFGLVNSDGTPKDYVNDLQNDISNQLAPAPVADLHGDVVDATTGTAITPPYGVTIYTNGIGRIAVRDDGTFELPGVKPGLPRTLVAINDGGTTGYGAWTTVIAPGVGDPGAIHVLLQPEASDASATGTVTGTIFDAHTGLPLSGDGARLFVYCANRRARVAGDGSYTLDGVGAGHHVIIAADTSRSLRYASSSWSVDISPDTAATLDFYMQPQ